jgi:glutamate-5-semialdehyde dehydrogenase
VNTQIHRAAADAKVAAATLVSVPTRIKNEVLDAIADGIQINAPLLLDANREDVERARSAGLSEAKIKRLALTPESVVGLAEGIRQVAALPDPVGQVTEERRVPSGLVVRRVRVPLGVVCMIYEARPGVTADAFALCFKAGNACLLKGGREASTSNTAIAAIIRGVLDRAGMPTASLGLVSTSDREEMKQLLSLDTLIDLVIPRGGEDLIRFVAQHSRIPTIQHFKGVCHLYVDASADLDRSIGVCVTSKVSNPATCNATECVLVDRAVAVGFLPRLIEAMRTHGVQVRGDAATVAIVPAVAVASPDDFGREFLDKILAVAVVEGVTGAVDHIRRYGSKHTEAVLARDQSVIEAFRRGVDASCVIVNAGTRFNDGFQLGLGAEIGISTTKLHAYGPMGLEELTTRRFEVVGDYQAR